MIVYPRLSTRSIRTLVHMAFNYIERSRFTENISAIFRLPLYRKAPAPQVRLRIATPGGV